MGCLTTCGTFVCRNYSFLIALVSICAGFFTVRAPLSLSFNKLFVFVKNLHAEFFLVCIFLWACKNTPYMQHERQLSWRHRPHPCLLMPAYRPLVKVTKVVEKKIFVLPEGSYEALQGCFSTTDWSMFRQPRTTTPQTSRSEQTPSLHRLREEMHGRRHGLQNHLHSGQSETMACLCKGFCLRWCHINIYNSVVS